MRLPIWFLSGGHQGNTRNAISERRLPFLFTLSLSPPLSPSVSLQRYVSQTTEPSPDAPEKFFSLSFLLSFFRSFFFLSLSPPPSFLHLCYFPLLVFWSQPTWIGINLG